MSKKKSGQSSTMPKELTSGFKFPSACKAVMALQYTDPHRAGEYKRVMVAAEKTYLANKKKKSVLAGNSADE